MLGYSCSIVLSFSRVTFWKKAHRLPYPKIFRNKSNVNPCASKTLGLSKFYRNKHYAKYVFCIFLFELNCDASACVLKISKVFENKKKHQARKIRSKAKAPFIVTENVLLYTFKTKWFFYRKYSGHLIANGIWNASSATHVKNLSMTDSSRWRKGRFIVKQVCLQICMRYDEYKSVARR